MREPPQSIGSRTKKNDDELPPLPNSALRQRAVALLFLVVSPGEIAVDAVVVVFVVDVFAASSPPPKSTAPDVMEYSRLLTWLPDDRDLPSYLRSQRVHHERRVRWNSSLLNRLGGMAAAAAD